MDPYHALYSYIGFTIMLWTVVLTFVVHRVKKLKAEVQTSWDREWKCHERIVKGDDWLKVARFQRDAYWKAWHEVCAEDHDHRAHSILEGKYWLFCNQEPCTTRQALLNGIQNMSIDVIEAQEHAEAEAFAAKAEESK